MKIFKNLLELFFPSCCLSCSSRLVTNEKHICLKCIAEIPLTNNYKQCDNKLEQVFAGRFPFQRVASYAHFTKGGKLEPLIYDLKYRNNPQLGVYLGELAGSQLKGSAFISGIDLLVPVPIHQKRLRTRGYNQSLKIAEGISKQTNIPIDFKSLVRVVNNPSQTGFSKADRLKNVEDIFTLENSDAFQNKHILLIDDIITTGSTLESCAKKTLTCENSKVSLFAIGSTLLS